MIPYFELSFLPAGSGFVSFHLLTSLAGLGLFHLLYVRHAVSLGLPRAQAEEFTFFAIVPGLFGAHLGFLFLANWPGGWDRVLNPLDGGIALAGLLCSFVAVCWRLRRWSATAAEWQQWFQVAARVFPWAWVVIRAGCFLTHDEPGIRTAFPLGVMYPDGTRHDLALYELLWAAAMIAAKPTLPQLLYLYGILRVTLHWLRPERHGLDLVLSALLLLAAATWGWMGAVLTAPRAKGSFVSNIGSAAVHKIGATGAGRWR